MIKDLTFITGNQSKADQLSRHLEFPVNHLKLDLVEIQSLNLEKVTFFKAKEAFAKIKKPVLVEDTSLTFKALGALPGPLIKWFLHELGNDGICKLLDGFDNRSALAEVCFGFYDGKNLKLVKSKMPGMIAKKPRGKAGFGWDPIFIPEGYDKTWGEMSDEEQKKSSMRRVALQKLEEYLKK